MRLSFEGLNELLSYPFQPVNRMAAANRAIFKTLLRTENHSIQRFTLELQVQAPEYDYTSQLDDQLGGPSIAGITVSELSQRLELLQEHTFQNVRNVCEQSQDAMTATTLLVDQILFISSKSAWRIRIIIPRAFKITTTYYTNCVTPRMSVISQNSDQNELSKCASRRHVHSRFSCSHP